MALTVPVTVMVCPNVEGDRLDVTTDDELALVIVSVTVDESVTAPGPLSWA
jgi:hypothetical protein